MTDANKDSSEFDRFLDDRENRRIYLDECAKREQELQIERDALLARNKRANEELDFTVNALRYVKAKLAPNAPKSLVFEEKWVDDAARVVEAAQRLLDKLTERHKEREANVEDGPTLDRRSELRVALEALDDH